MKQSKTSRRHRDIVRSGHVLGACLYILCVAPLWADSVDQTRDSGAAGPISQLIQQLGSTEFARREKARDELLSLGVDAFDALQNAQRHPDIEVRKQAEYLLRAIRIVWVHEDDAPKVRQILRNYRSEGLEERESRLKRLAQIEDGGGIEPLCRLVRFETSENLSKRAALLVMNATPPDVLGGEERWDQVIDRVMGTSQRAGARWLQLFARYLRDPSSTLDQWSELAGVEQREVKLRPDKIRLIILRDFMRWQVDLYERMGRRDEAIAAMWQTLELQDATRAEILATVDWLIERQAWPLIEVLAEQYSGSFESDPELMFRRAEAFRHQGRDEKAEAFVVLAMDIQKPDEPFLHVEVGRELQRRGMTDWAEREFRRVIEDNKVGAKQSLDARIRLGWMMHDLGNNTEAYQALKGVVDLMDGDKSVARRLDEMQRDQGRIRGQMHFSNALRLNEQQDSAAEVKELEKAIAADQLNADILIAMYRAPEASEGFRQKTKKMIQSLSSRFRSSALLAERNFQTVPNSDTREQLALMLNQYAWLVSNTEGDYRAALTSSKKSLDLIPDDPGYLDTLARCYYALEDYENAVAQQRRAVELDPHSGQIQRQLELFEDTLRKHRAEKAEEESKAP